MILLTIKNTQNIVYMHYYMNHTKLKINIEDKYYNNILGLEIATKLSIKYIVYLGTWSIRSHPTSVWSLVAIEKCLVILRWWH